MLRIAGVGSVVGCGDSCNKYTAVMDVVMTCTGRKCGKYKITVTFFLRSINVIE